MTTKLSSTGIHYLVKIGLFLYIKLFLTIFTSPSFPPMHTHTLGTEPLDDYSINYDIIFN